MLWRMIQPKEGDTVMCCETPCCKRVITSPLLECGVCSKKIHAMCDPKTMSFHWSFRLYCSCTLAFWRQYCTDKRGIKWSYILVHKCCNQTAMHNSYCLVIAHSSQVKSIQIISNTILIISQLGILALVSVIIVYYYRPRKQEKPQAYPEY